MTKSKTFEEVTKTFATEKPVNQSLKDKNNRHFKDEKHSLLNVSGIGNARIKTEAGDIQFEDGLAVLPNDGQADEIEAELRENALHPAQVHRVERSKYTHGDKVHNYHFGPPQCGWPEFDENGRRIS
jgi:hypothetical protein